MIKNTLQKLIKMSFVLGILFQAFSINAGQLSIVIDDIGYHAKLDSEVYSLPREVSVAIIPSAPYAKQRNQLAKQQNRDILIHMPMQPINNQKIEEGGLLLGLSQNEVNQRVINAKRILPDAVGMNNHMGSAATSDVSLMQKLMVVLHDQNLAFLDSKTTGRSVAAKIARQHKIPTLERHIFLDNSDQVNSIRTQFDNAIRYARKQGVAIVIGHPRRNTLNVLKNGIENLPTDIKLVGIASLWKGTMTTVKPMLIPFSDTPASTSVAPFEKIPLLRGVPK
ncbi:divergent polysaccharide deacetylase family protein [Seminibacterium arietis]|uniref:Divergent polysaccharide deacetylase family protein n=1 Tax=Seminibacterium arietis TaxID=1173502 RepID=A0ABW3I9L1_9PAST